uniref:Glycosyltransferase n=1 Tax=Nelumbo nucifera TaxID=4432 RepID=A0A822Y813_NELNU|nr:TPA_asm: hypothetical protein HUJ06_028824 [Nelumbo nucifera]
MPLPEMSDTNTLHVAILPSSGMGHLVPAVRLAASLAARNCRITFITTHPTVSLAESRLVSRLVSFFPNVTRQEFHLLPLDRSTANSNDPFCLQFETIRRSAHLLSPILSSCSPPLSALVTDPSLVSAVIPITEKLRLANYNLFIASPKMLSLLIYFPTIANTDLSTTSSKTTDYIEIPGIPPLPKSWLPPPLVDPSSLFRTQFIANGQEIVKSDGILVNAFDSLDKATVAALNGGKVMGRLPPVITVGPFVPLEFEKGSPVEWLDRQPVGSVVYVCFGNRTAASREQIRELGDGLERSGCRFLWVVKEKKVGEIVGHGFLERVKEKGLVVKSWVEQGEVLAHPAVGLFLSHCGWNSITEAALYGVPILGWPQGGDQKINGEVIPKSGLGIWVETWGWEEIVKGEEIGDKIREMMGDEKLKVQAARIGEEARKSVGVGGSSYKGLEGLVEKMRKGRA